MLFYNIIAASEELLLQASVEGEIGWVAKNSTAHKKRGDFVFSPLLFLVCNVKSRMWRFINSYHVSSALYIHDNGRNFRIDKRAKKSFLVGCDCALLLGGCSSLSRCTFLLFLNFLLNVSGSVRALYIQGGWLLLVYDMHTRQREKAMFVSFKLAKWKRKWKSYSLHSSSCPYLEIPIFIHT